MYQALFSVLRRVDPEVAHHLGMLVLRGIQLPGLAGMLTKLNAMPAALGTTTMGLHFSNPFGVAAGFDKNAEVVSALGALGFGHVEVGTITPRPQPGNPTPRLFRLPLDYALINRMGFNNDGSVEVAKRLRRLRQKGRLPIIGVNIGKNKDTPLDRAAEDYRRCAGELAEFADYLVINVSSPNTPGLRSLQDPEHLESILDAVRREAGSRPIAVKLSPDLPPEDIVAVSHLVNQLAVEGVVATNTTVSREGLITDPATIAQIGEGGLSGAPLAHRSQEVLSLLRESLQPGVAIISVGGVSTGADAHRRLQAGADLVQLYTSFVYRGPLVARKLAQELALETA